MTERFEFVSLRSLIGLRISRYFLDQSEVKAETNRDSLRHGFRASLELHVFASRFDWFTRLFVPFVIALARKITLVLVLRHSIEIHSIRIFFLHQNSREKADSSPVVFIQRARRAQGEMGTSCATLPLPHVM